MLVGWLVVPVLLCLLIAGCGLLAEWLLGRLPGLLVPAAGVAVLMVTGAALTTWDATAELAVPAAVALALAGFALGRERLRDVRPWAAAAAAGAFALLAAPSLLSGQGSIAGYVALDDTATWLALTAHVMESGRDLSGLAPSSHQLTLQVWLGSGYPTGAFMPLGIGSRLAGSDPLLAYTAVIALYGAVAALGLAAAVSGLVKSLRLAAVCGLLGVQASMFYGYAQMGGIKEAAVVALLPAAAVAAVSGLFAPACLLAAALAVVLGLPGLVWVLPVLALALLRGPFDVRGIAALALGAVPLMATLNFADQALQSTGGLRNTDDLGNLPGPLSPLQALGLWPAGDFRVDPDPRGLAIALALLAGAGAVAAVLRALERRKPGVPALAGVALAGAVPALLVGSAWVDAKVYAIVSPLLLAAAAAWVASSGSRVRAAGGAVLVAAIAWSTLAVWRDVRVAPRERLAELAGVADRLGDRGPALLLDFDAYGSRYLLRRAEVEGATDLRHRRVERRDGTLFTERGNAEIDEIAPESLVVYDALVRRATPTGSRPPAAFRRTFGGEHWELWERGGEGAIARLPLGDGLIPASVPACPDVRALAQTEGAGELVALPRTRPVLLEMSEQADLEIPVTGRWRVWVGGSLRRELEARVDGRSAGTRRHELAHAGQWMRFGALPLSRGIHRLTLDVERRLRPGAGGEHLQAPLGPVALTLEEDAALSRVPVADYRRLCDGTTYDWIEAVR